MRLSILLAEAQTNEGLLTIDIFKNLPRNFQIGIVIRAYEVNEDVEWSITPGNINWLNDTKTVNVLINDYKNYAPKQKFAYGYLPIDFIIAKIMNSLDYKHWNNWEEYHQWYGENAKHSSAALPILVSDYNEEYIEDGWHRFHRYYDLGIEEVPVVKYL